MLGGASIQQFLRKVGLLRAYVLWKQAMYSQWVMGCCHTDGDIAISNLFIIALT